MANKGKLCRKWEQALAALLVEPSLAKAANASGVSLATLKRWLRSAPAFQEAFAERRKAILDFASARLEAATEAALEKLIELLDDDDPAIRLRAANSILDRVEKTSGPPSAESTPFTGIQFIEFAERPGRELTADTEVGS